MLPRARAGVCHLRIRREMGDVRGRRILREARLISYLDRMIRRLTAQRECLEWAFGQIRGLPGPVLEFGLGNGRSYDHLRTHLPDREIYVFDNRVAAHPACIPPEDRMLLGDFRDTAPAAVGRFGGIVALIHADVGSSDWPASRALAAELAPYWAALLQPGGLLVSDQPLEAAGFAEVTIERQVPGHYYLFRRLAEAA